MYQYSEGLSKMKLYKKTLTDFDILYEYFDEEGYKDTAKNLKIDAQKLFMELASKYGGYDASNALLAEIHAFTEIASNPKYIRYSLIEN